MSLLLPLFRLCPIALLVLTCLILPGQVLADDPLFDCSQVDEIPLEQCEALVALYEATDGDNWIDNTNWLQNTNPSTWQGITFEQGALAYIELPNNALSGTLPSELGQIASLQGLQLNDNSLTGPVPPELGQLDNVWALHLSYNGLTGTLPVELAEMDSLWVMDVAGNQLEGTIPPEYCDLDTLGYLHLYENQLNGEIPEDIGRMSRLLAIRLSDNNLTGRIPQSLSTLVDLEVLDLRSNDLNGPIPQAVTALGNLTYLSLSRNHLSGAIPSDIGNLERVSDLRLGCNELSGELPLSIIGMEALYRLGLEDNQLTTSDPAVAAFVDDLSPSWRNSQTVPPTGILVDRVLSDRVTVSWQAAPVLNLYGGVYEVGMASQEGGAYSVAGHSERGDLSLTVHGLSAEMRYWFSVRTVPRGSSCHPDGMTSAWAEGAAVQTAGPGTTVYLPLIHGSSG